MGLEWHDRRRDSAGRFARRDYSARINLRMTEEMLEEIRRRACAAEMEISDYVVSCVLADWAARVPEISGAGAARRQVLEKYAPRIYAAAQCDAAYSQLIDLYNLHRDERQRMRKEGMKIK